MKEELIDFMDKHAASKNDMKTVEFWVNWFNESINSNEPNESETIGNNEQTQEECDHPYSTIMSKCNGELNYCLKCGKYL